MDYPSGSFPSSSSLPPSSSSDIERQTHLAYSNPLQTTPDLPFQSQNPGLGISYCEIEPPTNYSRQYPSSEQYVADWTGQFMPSTLPLGCSLNTNHITPVSFYEPYAGSDASTSPLSYCGPQAMSASSSRGSALDPRAGPDTMSTQTYNFSPNTPRSDTDIVKKKECDTDYQDGAYIEYAKPASMPLFAPVPQYRTNDFLPKLEFSGEDKTRDSIVVDHGVDANQLPEPPAFPTAIFPSCAESSDGLPDRGQPKILLASGQECIICGAKFTRRSNCREHMRKHNPTARKTFPCEECGKALGRRTDLKRHVESVHRGIRKFGCEQCGARFSRPDTLTRHVSDGCRRVSRRSSESKRAGGSRSPSQAKSVIKGR
ncbi:hypothetical protein BDW62DRAFT_67989 [Aspergillus aurantiobrunneus]